MSKEIFKDCLEEAFKLIKVVTNETETEQKSRYLRDAAYHTAIEHLANLYYLIRTNRHFQDEQERLYRNMVALSAQTTVPEEVYLDLLESLSKHPGEIAPVKERKKNHEI